MSESNVSEEVIWEIVDSAAGEKISAFDSLESFFMSKLGFSAGKNLYKELLRAVSADKDTAVDLTTKRGKFVKYRRR